MHSLSSPRSYDNVIPSSELGGVVVEPAPHKPKQWWVSSRWLTDSDLYNEWMNEEDYELLLVVSVGWRESRWLHSTSSTSFLPAGWPSQANCSLPWLHPKEGSEDTLLSGGGGPRAVLTPYLHTVTTSFLPCSHPFQPSFSAHSHMFNTATPTHTHIVTSSPPHLVTFSHPPARGSGECSASPCQAATFSISSGGPQL